MSDTHLQQLQLKSILEIIVQLAINDEIIGHQCLLKKPQAGYYKKKKKKKFICCSNSNIIFLLKNAFHNVSWLTDTILKNFFFILLQIKCDSLFLLEHTVRFWWWYQNITGRWKIDGLLVNQIRQIIQKKHTLHGMIFCKTKKNFLSKNNLTRNTTMTIWKWNQSLVNFDILF